MTIENEAPPSTTPTTEEVKPLITPPAAEEVKADEVKPDEAKKEEAKSEAPAPLTIESLKAPEGIELDKEAVGSFLEILNDTNLAPGDRANKLVALQANLAKSWSEKITADWETFNNAQIEESKSDKELGPKMDETLAGISTLINTYGSPELRLVMNNSGAGNNIHVIRFLDKIAKQLNEGKAVSGLPTGDNSFANAASKMFPSMKEG